VGIETDLGEPKKKIKSGRKPIRPLDTTFDNGEYWERRYVDEPERGAGVGTRGKNLNRKRKLLVSLVDEIQPASILDVGCGDLEIVADLSFPGSYTGIDISPTVNSRNRLLRPDWTFLDGDFLELARTHDLSADLVICFDVLIHQVEPETYHAFVRELVNSTRKSGLINGFRNPLKGGRQLRICAFHERITESLAAAGAENIQVLGKLRGTAIVRFDSPAQGEASVES
jgi:SAM-dependent methyltransferase